MRVPVYVPLRAVKRLGRGYLTPVQPSQPAQPACARLLRPLQPRRIGGRFLVDRLGRFEDRLGRFDDRLGRFVVDRRGRFVVDRRGRFVDRFGRVGGEGQCDESMMTGSGVVKVSFNPTVGTPMDAIDVAVFRQPRSGNENGRRVSAVRRLKPGASIELLYNTSRDSFWETFYLVWASSFGTYLAPDSFEDTVRCCWMDMIDIASWPQKVQVSGTFGIGSKPFTITDKNNVKFISPCHFVTSPSSLRRSPPPPPPLPPRPLRPRPSAEAVAAYLPKPITPAASPLARPPPPSRPPPPRPMVAIEPLGDPNKAKRPIGKSPPLPPLPPLLVAAAPEAPPLFEARVAPVAPVKVVASVAPAKAVAKERKPANKVEPNQTFTTENMGDCIELAEGNSDAVAKCIARCEAARSDPLGKAFCKRQATLQSGGSAATVYHPSFVYTHPIYYARPPRLVHFRV
jgi:hypothetical protein